MLLAMACLLMCSLIACGTKDDDDEDDTPSIVKGSVEEMAEALQDVKAGKTTFDIKVSTRDEEGRTTSFKIGGNVAFDRSSNKCSVALSYDGGNVKIDETELVRVTGDVLYFNLDSVGGVLKQYVLRSADGEKSEIEDVINDLTGWFAFPLPSDINGKFNIFGDKNPILGLVSAVSKSATMEGEKGDYTITLKSADDYKNALGAIKDYSDKNLKDILKTMVASLDNVKKIDLNNYAKEIISTYKKDLQEYLREHGEEYGFTEDDLDKALKTVEDQDLNKLYEQYLEQNGGSQLKNIKDEDLNRIVVQVSEELSKAIGEVSGSSKLPETKVRFFADDDGYVLEVKAEDNSKDGAEKIEFTVRTDPGSASVKKPDNIAGIKFILDIIGPAYTRYVEKSRMSTDISSVSDIMAGAEKVAVDPQYDLSAGTLFTLNFNNGKVTLNVSGGSDQAAQALSEWQAISFWGDSRDSYKLKTTSYASAKGTITGVLQMNGSVMWEYSSGSKAFDSFMDYSADFRKKWFN